MKISEIAKKTIQSGLTPIRLEYYVVRSFEEANPIMLRSTLVLESLELGVLTPKEYRFVARRTKQGDELVERHIEKLFASYGEIVDSCKEMRCITIPVFPRTLQDGRLAELLFQGFTKYPQVEAKRICMELSSDLLFEDFEAVKGQISRLRELGIKIAINEVGHELCPLSRLTYIAPDYIFTDALPKETMETDAEQMRHLVKFLHFGNAEVMAPVLEDEKYILLAQTLDFDGFLSGELFLPKKDEGDVR